MVDDRAVVELQEARAAIRDLVTILDTDNGGGPYQPNGISRQWVVDKLRALLPKEAP